MNPFTGILPSRGNAPGYRYASPDGDGWAVVATAAHFLTQSPSDHCPLSTIHWTHTFSAKERDSETGLSYFGSRYYSSDLSIWLSVDPQASKYPSLSPYTYCADNPVKLVDPNGEEMLETDYRNYKGELLYRTNDGLEETIIVSNYAIPELKQKIQQGIKQRVIDSPEYNKKEMHPLGKTPEQYKESKEGAKSNVIGDTWRTYYRIGYEEAYNKGKKKIGKLVLYSTLGFLDVNSDSGGGAQEKYEGWSTGQVEGLQDKRNGYINAMDPTSSFKDNAPLIKIR